MLLIGHLFGDFYLQSSAMARRKDAEAAAMCRHGLVYFFAILAAVLPFMLIYDAMLSFWALFLLVPASHFAIDFAKNRWPGWKAIFNKNDKYVFVVDQVAHVVIIVIVALYYATKAPVAYIAYSVYVQNLFILMNLGVPLHKIIQMACLFLFLGKPTAMFMQILLKNDDEGDAGDSIILKKEQKAGGLIGIFERYLAVILVITQQYSALAFIVTAKSIARFNKISDEPEFAERYLLGTLGSVLFAVAGAVMYLQLP